MERWVFSCLPFKIRFSCFEIRPADGLGRKDAREQSGAHENSVARPIDAENRQPPHLWQRDAKPYTLNQIQ